MTLNKKDRVYNDPPESTIVPKEYYIYALVGAVSAFAGGVFVAWYMFDFVLEPWQLVAMLLVNPVLGATMSFMILSGKAE